MATTSDRISGPVPETGDGAREPTGAGTTNAHPRQAFAPAHSPCDELEPERLGILARLVPARRHQWRQANERWLKCRRAQDPRIEFDRSFEIVPHSRYLIHNRTPYLIRITHAHDEHFGELVLPPFAERVIKGARLRPYAAQVQLHRQRHEIFVKRHEEEVTWVSGLMWFIWMALALWFAATVYDIARHGTVLRPEWWGAFALTIVLTLTVLGVAAAREHRRRRRAAENDTEAGDIARGAGSSYTDGNETAGRTRQLFTLALVILVGAVLPAAAVVFATDLKTFVDLDGGLTIKEGTESRVISRLIQITYTILLSLFPALLFFQFDRQRAGLLRATWVRALFRMDGRLRTLADVHATYGDGLYEASGNSEDSVRVLGGKYSPIVVATVLIALGWTVLVVRTESFAFDRATVAQQQADVAAQQASAAQEAAEVAETAADEGDDAAAAAAAAEATAAAEVADEAQSRAASAAAAEPTAEQSEPGSDEPATESDLDTTGAATTPSSSEEATAQAQESAANASSAAEQAVSDQQAVQATPFYQLLAPNPSAAGMAFLGAYFFGVYLVLRSYFGGDLRAKIYNQITARLVTVVVIAYLINALRTDNIENHQTIWGLAFLAGIVPTTVIKGTFKVIGGWVGKIADDTFAARNPLVHIDGIDIYEASRLEAEGIPDTVALATSDLSSVMLHTRLPVGQLVDWADQAALMVVVNQGTGTAVDPRMKALRSRGIRTGTELLAAIEGNDPGDLDEISVALGKKPPARPRVRFWRAPEPPAEGTTGSSEVPVGHGPGEPEVDFTDLCLAIRRQPVMNQILQWRSSALNDVDRNWIPLPEMGSPPPRSRCYVGPLPSPSCDDGRQAGAVRSGA